MKSSKSQTFLDSESLEHRIQDPESVQRSNDFWSSDSLSMVASRMRSDSASRTARLVRMASVLRKLSLVGDGVLMNTGWVCLFGRVRE